MVALKEEALDVRHRLALRLCLASELSRGRAECGKQTHTLMKLLEGRRRR